MVATSVDAALIDVAAAARAAEKDAKRERARVMDAMLELLFERAEMRMILREALPYLWTTAATYAAINDQALMPKVMARRIEELLRGDDHA